MKYRIGLLLIMNLITGVVFLFGFYIFSGFLPFLVSHRGKDVFPLFVVFHFGLIVGLLELFGRFNREMVLYQMSISIVIYLVAAWLFGYFT